MSFFKTGELMTDTNPEKTAEIKRVNELCDVPVCYCGNVADNYERSFVGVGEFICKECR